MFKPQKRLFHGGDWSLNIRNRLVAGQALRPAENPIGGGGSEEELLVVVFRAWNLSSQAACFDVDLKRVLHLLRWHPPERSAGKQEKENLVARLGGRYEELMRSPRPVFDWLLEATSVADLGVSNLIYDFFPFSFVVYGLLDQKLGGRVASHDLRATCSS
ncbi:unnamed protein product [Calypogeia fissa]